MGDPANPGSIRGFRDTGVELWVDTVVSYIGVEDVLGTGIGGGFDGIRETPALIEFVRMRRMGSAEYLGHDAGAIKFARTGDIAGPVVRYCDIEDVQGNGVWADVQACSMDVLSTRIVGVGRKGVHWEKSGRSDELGPLRDGRLRVDDVTVIDSGREGRQHAADGAFTVVSSVHARYTRCRSEGARRADFFVRQDDRLSGDKHGWRVEDVTLVDPDGWVTRRIIDDEARGGVTVIG
jgi:hypothetical protein